MDEEEEGAEDYCRAEGELEKGYVRHDERVWFVVDVVERRLKRDVYFVR